MVIKKYEVPHLPKAMMDYQEILFAIWQKHSEQVTRNMTGPRKVSEYFTSQWYAKAVATFFYIAKILTNSSFGYFGHV